MSGCVFFVTLVLPHLLQGDATPQGQMRIAIAYPLTIVFVLLILGTLWLSSGLIAREIEGGEIQLVVVKPVRPVAIWLGKWLALLAINVLLVTLAVAGILVSSWLIAGGSSGEDVVAMRQSVLTARQEFVPDAIPGLNEKAERELARQIRQRLVEPDSGLARVRGEIMAARSMVFAGKCVDWPVTLSQSAFEHARHDSLSLRYRFHCDPTERVPASGVWHISSGAANAKVAVSNVLDGVHHLMLPAGFKPDAEKINISFKSSSDNPTLYFDPERPVTILVHRGGFAGNLLRSGLALICFLAAVAAIGLTMSAMFSFPVAAFCAAAIIFAVVLAGSFSEVDVEREHSHHSADSRLVQVTEPAIVFLKHATDNITVNLPISDVSGGMFFGYRRLAELVVLLLLLTPSVCGLVAVMVLSQKEMAV
jgi:ABC-type transport system involved in multi-copper enzyme maturation permease subunit